MAKPRIDILEAQLEDFPWYQVCAIRNGHCLGTATVYFIGPGTAPQLCNMFVQPNARRQGIASAMIEAVRNYLKRPFCLHVVRDSEAHRLYHKLGFLSIGAVKEKPDSVWMLSPS